MQSDTYLGKIEDILDRERAALLSGQLDVVQRLALEKDALGAQANPAGFPAAAQVKRLKEKADGNQRLLDAALKGVRAVAQRLQSFGKERADLNTYGRDGARQSTGTPGRSSFEKRA